MKSIPLALAVALPFVGFQVQAASNDARHLVRIGYADIQFNVESGALTGPTGTTPPDVLVAVDDVSTLALVYEYRLSGPWSLVAQAGTPPTIDMYGDGAATPLGKVGSAKAWFPAVLVAYNFDFQWVEPYVAAGVNYTWFTDEKVTSSYNQAFGGTDSQVELDDSFGGVVKLGAEFPVAEDWTVGLSYSRYWISTTAEVTTATPGVGDIQRSIEVDADPDVYAMTFGYKF